MFKDSIKTSQEKNNHRTFKLETIKKTLLILLFMEKQIKEKVGKFAKDTDREKKEYMLTISPEHCLPYHTFIPFQE